MLCGSPSMFYNFVWIWGSDDRNRNLFTDWGSYDFTVSEKVWTILPQLTAMR